MKTRLQTPMLVMGNDVAVHIGKASTDGWRIIRILPEDSATASLTIDATELAVEALYTALGRALGKES